MELLFNQFKKLVTRRLNYHNSFKCFGEDSIRYDFYCALMQHFKLKPHQIILEQAIPNSQFLQSERNHALLAQGRHFDKPEFDLRVDPHGDLEYGILIEFAFFRNPPIGKVDTSGSHGKILNEIHRLALLKQYDNQDNNPLYENFTNYKCLLICVTDEVMINYGQGTRGRKPILIQDNYILSNTNIELFPPNIKNKIQDRFKLKISELNTIPIATRFINLEIQHLNKPWGIWAWEVSYQNN